MVLFCEKYRKYKFRIESLVYKKIEAITFLVNNTFFIKINISLKKHSVK